MTFGQGRGVRNRVICVGQSLNAQPLAYTFAQKLYDLLLGEAIVTDTSLAGIAWVQWASSDWRHRLEEWATRAERVDFAFMGGTTDYDLGQDGSQVYANQVSLSTALRALNPSGVKIIGSTTHPSSAYGLRTTVASGSNGVLASSLTDGTLNVASTTDGDTSGVVFVETTTGEAVFTYTGKTGTTLTHVAFQSGSGSLFTGGYARSPEYRQFYLGNALVLADPSGAFDQIVDYAGDARLADPTDLTYYQVDKTHWNAAGRDVGLELFLPKYRNVRV